MMNLLHRSATIERSDEGEDLYTITGATESPVRRLMKINGKEKMIDEVLSHADGDVDMSFIGTGRAPLLDEHDQKKQIGVIRRAWIQDRQLKATVKFSSNELGQQIKRDVDEQVRLNVSVGYPPPVYRHDGGDTYTAIGWRPMELSSVSIPFDPNAMFGRAFEPEKVIHMTAEGTISGESKPENNNLTNDLNLETRSSNIELVNERDLQQQALEAEKKRVDYIIDMGRKLKMSKEAEEAVTRGISYEDFSRDALNKMTERQATSPAGSDIPKKDMQAYSLTRLMRSQCANSLGLNPIIERDKAGLEWEISDYLNKEKAKAGLTERGDGSVCIPHTIFTTRTMNATLGAASEGAELVDMVYRPDMFIDALREASVFMNLGVQTLNNLRGNLQIPKLTGRATATWLSAEDAAANVSEPSFGHINLSPKTIAIRESVTRQMLLQSDPSIEALLRREMLLAMGRGMDIAGFAGTGLTGQPTGVLNLTNKGEVDIDTFSQAKIIEMVETHMSQLSYTLPGMAWVTNHVGYRQGRSTPIFTNGERPILEAPSNPGNSLIGSLESHPVYQSQNLPTNLGGATNQSPLILGAWSSVIVGFWGGLDILTDPYTDSNRGRVNYTAFQSTDIQFRHEQSMVVGLGAGMV